MKRLILSIIFLILLVVPVYSQNIKVHGIASKGGKIVRTSALVQHTLMETYPSCTITIYQTGTLTLASIFSDEIGTVKSNPFTANLDASWFFYVAQGRYDIKFSGTGILTPFTVSDVFVNSGGGGGGGGSVTSVFGRTGDVVYQIGDVPFTGLNFSGSNFNSIQTRSASDLNAGTLPDATFPATLPAVSGVNLTNLNATNITSGILNDARLSTNVPLKNAINIFTQNNIFNSSVGINTSTPRRRLDVLDGSSAQLRLSAVDNAIFTDLFVDSGGSLNVLPTGNTVFNSTGKQVNPLNNFDQNLGQINKKWLSLHAAELFVETLVAQNTIATIGGRILVAPSNILIADLAPATTTIQVKYNNLANGDRIYMEGNNSVEFMAVTSGASVIAGGFSYTVTRNLDGTGANQWFGGDALVNTGVAGNGFIDLYSLRGVKASTQIGPTIVGNVRNSSTYNDWTERWAVGNLNGIFGYGTDTYGAAFGVPTGAWIKIDPTNGVRIGHNNTTRTQIDAAGNASFSGNITAASGTIGGWTINPDYINSGTTYLASNFDMPGSGIMSWFGRAPSGMAGYAYRDSTNKAIFSHVSNGSIYPYTAYNDGTRYRVVIGGLNNAWGTDGSTDSMGMKIWDSAGNKLVEFSDLANNIGGLNISSTKVFIGAGNYSNTDTAFFVDNTGRFSLKDKLVWDGSTLIINGGGSFSGTLSAATGTFAGSLSAATGTFSGSLSAATGTFTGDLTGANMQLTGKLSINSDSVILNSDGITLEEGSTNVNIIKWRTPDFPNTNYGSIYAQKLSATLDAMHMTLQAESGNTASVTDLIIESQNSNVRDTSIWLRKYGTTHATKPDFGFATILASNGVAIVRGSWPYAFQEAATSAALDIQSTTGAFLPPRMTTTERDALTPTNGMIIYNTTTGEFNFRKAGAWVATP